jgi:hypothetical protein
MVDADAAALSSLISNNEVKLLSSWLGKLEAGSVPQIKEDELKEQSRPFLREFVPALKSGDVDDVSASEWKTTRDLLCDFSRSRALRGFTAARDRDLHLFHERALVLALARRDQQRRSTACQPDLGDHHVSRQARTLPVEPR